MAGLEFRTDKTLSEADQANFIRIYEDSFPRSERDDTGTLLSSIAAGDRDCHIVSLNGDLVGFAVLITLSKVQMPFLEYFAVDSTWRNQGIGSRFLAQVTEELRSGQTPPDGIVFEVEPPNHAVCEEQRVRQRRIGFYQRNGAVVVDCATTYRAPNLEQEGTVPYWLMWLPLRPKVGRLDGDLLRRTVAAILTESYELAGDDPLVHAVVTELTC